MSDVTPDVSGQGLSYDVDIVLCIDATMSMVPVIEEVKAKALRFPDDLLAEMADKNKNVSKLRLKVIAFRDIFVDSPAFLVSDFFTMPDQKADFESFMRTVSAEGGGDEPESGLEALALAMNSDWCSGSNKGRHLIVVWTDASAHPIEKGAGSVPSEFAASVPGSMGELIDQWNSESQTSKLRRNWRRLVMFAPDADPWTGIEADWEEAIHFPSTAGDGLADFEYKEILDIVARSV